MAMGRGRQTAGLAALGVAYLAAVSGTIALTRFDGGVAFLWIASAILTARLVILPSREWPLPMAVCFLANVVATSAFGLGPALALPLGVANIGEASLGAYLLRRYLGRATLAESHRWLIVFVLGAGIAAPLASAALAGASIALIRDQAFFRTAFQWYSGHALGTLAFMPIALLIMRGEARRLITRMPRSKLVEMLALISFVALVTLWTFAQDGLPLLFLPMLPIVLATFRGGPLSTAASIVVLAVIGGALTLQGHGPIALIDAPVGGRMQFLQFYIAFTMLTVLPANAELQRRAELFRRLRESEARYRLVTETSTDIILNCDVDGRLRFVSASIQQIGGRRPEDLIGRPVGVLLHPDDAPRALAAVQHLVADPGGVLVSEYRALGENKEVRWFETQSRAVVDDDGSVTGVVTAIRDITHRRAHEERLARAALTDALTGLMNRRGLDEDLALRLQSGAGGCIALFDLDHFKQVNDTYGHPAGDEVLRRFATLARSSLREQDVIARLGGEEFAVVLPEATMEQARLVCDRLRRAVADARTRVDGMAITVTVSGGVARYHEGQQVEDVLRAADIALYRAKRAGRDQLVLAA